MVHKENFKRAYGKLKVKEAPIVKETIMKRCKWSHQTFSHKKEGKRGFILEETDIVETTFRAFGIDAWSFLIQDHMQWQQQPALVIVKYV